ncbi:MAG: PadR family transcriptional regulator [Planctomycetaceae bacterium]|nr:PadR family transcriptional regulator [Planctomycetaceae bacterium]
MAKKADKAELLQGTLDMLILKSLQHGPRHGYSIAQWIGATTHDALRVEEGSLYPALHRMERRGWIAATWGQSESNRRAKFYQLTRTGRSQLGAQVDMWGRLVSAISLVLDVDAVEGSR